jgi:hypothetical protein
MSSQPAQMINAPEAGFDIPPSDIQIPSPLRENHMLSLKSFLIKFNHQAQIPSASHE